MGQLITAIILITFTSIVHFLTVGMSCSLGVFHIEFLRVFNASSGVTSWIGSINFATLCAAGALSSYPIKRIGCDRTIFIAGLISSIGTFINVFADNIYIIFIFLGFVTGFGYGLGFVALMTVINENLSRWRVLGMGISLSGVGIGTFIQPILLNYLIASYGWRGTLLIATGLQMHVCLCAMVIKLALSTKVKDTNNTVTVVTDVKIRRCSTSESDISKVFDISSSLELDINGNSKDSGSVLQLLPTEEKHLYQIPTYWLLHINSFLYCFGHTIIYTHVSAFAINVGFSLNLSSTFVSIVGLSHCFGRIGLGILAHYPPLQKRITLLFALCYITAGIWAILYAVIHLYFVMAINLVLLGISTAAFGPILSEVVLQTVGLDRFSQGYGYIMISMCAGALLGAPTAGWFYDLTNNYRFSFYMAGISFILGGVVMIIPNMDLNKFKYCKMKVNVAEIL